MATKTRSIDGLVHRLLQESAKPSAAIDRLESSAKPAGHSASSSPEEGVQKSEKPHEAHAELSENPGEKALESHLLNLYRSKGKGGG